VHVCGREAVRVCDLVVKSSSCGSGDPTAEVRFGWSRVIWSVGEG
jgi:hypothetical protein